MARRKQMVGWSEEAARVLKRADPAGRRHGARAVAAWREVVGPEVALRTRGFALRESGELVVFVESAAWATQLQLMSEELLARLNSHLGHNEVRHIRFTVSRNVSTEATWRTMEDEVDAFYQAEDTEPLPLSATELRQAEHVAQAIKDPSLRALALRVMVKDLELKKGRNARRTKSGDGLTD